MVPLAVVPWVVAWVGLLGLRRCPSAPPSTSWRGGCGRPAGRAGRSRWRRSRCRWRSRSSRASPSTSAPGRRGEPPVRARAGAADHRVRPGQPPADGAGGARLPRRAAALAARPAHRHRGGDQADPRGVRAVLPAAPRVPRRRRHGRRRCRRHPDRVRRRAWPVVDVLARQPGRRGERLAVLHQPDVPGRARAGRGRRIAEDVWLLLSVALLALAVPAIRRAPLRSPSSPPRGSACSCRRRRGHTTGCGSRRPCSSRPPRRGAALVHLARGHRGRLRCSWSRPTSADCPRDGTHLDPAPAGVGSTYVWFTVLLYVLLWTVWRHLRGTRERAVAYCMAKPGAVPDTRGATRRQGRRQNLRLPRRLARGQVRPRRRRGRGAAVALPGRGLGDGLHRALRLVHGRHRRRALPDDELLELVDASYDAVVAKLPKRLRPA